jgi:2-amino-4-hydroxy-6-hydroxymethyldihydropteridine diphosphokinase
MDRIAGPHDAVLVAVGLGSNLGDRTAHLDFAIARLDRLLANLRVSSYRNTSPHDVPTPQPDFLNAAAVGFTHMSARGILSALLGIERERARERPFRGAPRTLDLDLLFYGADVLSEEGLSVPHPRLRERVFVLEPLAEIAPALRDPVSGRTVGDLLTAAIARQTPATRRP